MSRQRRPLPESESESESELEAQLALATAMRELAEKIEESNRVVRRKMSDDVNAIFDLFRRLDEGGTDGGHRPT